MVTLGEADVVGDSPQGEVRVVGQDPVPVLADIVFALLADTKKRIKSVSVVSILPVQNAVQK